jgi:hypothetical protein
VLVTGAEPIGLLAALLGSQRGLDVHVLDQVEEGAKPRLLRDLGATYHHGEVGPVADRLRPDVVVEATGADEVVFAAMGKTAPFGSPTLSPAPTMTSRSSSPSTNTATDG